MKPQTAEWIEKAEGDWKVAQREWESPTPVYDAVCFHAQQAVEKYLKALLEEYGVAIPKTHDLVVLLGLLPEGFKEWGKERNSFASLSTYAVAFRYPGDSALKEDAEESLQIAASLRTLIRTALNLID